MSPVESELYEGSEYYIFPELESVNKSFYNRHKVNS